MPRSDRSSPWVYIGIGCLVFVVLGAICGGIGAWWLYHGFQKVGADLKDPVRRQEIAESVLGAKPLPEGYHAMVAIEAPLGLMRLAILTDREPDDDGEISGFGEWGFIYVETVKLGWADQEELRDYFEGRTSDPRVLRDNNINIDVDEIIARGVVALDIGSLMYVAQRGSFSTQGHSGEGVSSILLADCPDDERMRMGVWFGPDPDPSTPVAELDLAGSAADEAEIGRFVRQFRICPR